MGTELSTYYLTTFEKLVLAGILPRTGDILQLREIKALQDITLTIPLDELRLHVQFADDGLFKGTSQDFAQPVELTAGQKTIVINTLRDLETRKKLDVAHITLYEKFVENKNYGPPEATE
jgi:hypothetical protein